MSKEAPELIRSVKRFFSGTMISRVSGLGRDMSMAYAFGSQPIVAAFMVAFRFSNVLRRLLGEGAMQSAFVPHFEEIRSECHKRGARFFLDLSVALTGILLILVGFIELGLWAWLAFGSPSPDNAQVIKLTAIMFPGILFICLYGLNSSLLQCEGRFFTSGVAPAAFNLISIAAIFFLQDLIPQKAIPLLAFAIVLAYFFQWMMTVPHSYLYLLAHLPRNWWRGIQIRSEDLRRLGKPLFLGILGVSASQINNAIDPLFARAADLEGPAYLWYAIRLQQLPLALFGIAFSSALLPALAKTVASNELQNYIALLGSGLRRCLCLMIPCAFGLFVMGAAGINLIYGRGDFNDHSIVHTVLCLWAYSFGVVPQTLVIILASALYAQKNYRKTAQSALYAMVLNAFLNILFVFVFQMSAASVALATSLAAFFNCLFLGFILWKELRLEEKIINEIKLTFRCIWKIFLISLMASVIVLGLGFYFLQDKTLFLMKGSLTEEFPKAFSQQFLTAILEGLFFCGFIWLGAWSLRLEDLLGLFRLGRAPKSPKLAD